MTLCIHSVELFEKFLVEVVIGILILEKLQKLSIYLENKVLMLNESL